MPNVDGALIFEKYSCDVKKSAMSLPLCASGAKPVSLNVKILAAFLVLNSAAVMDLTPSILTVPALSNLNPHAPSRFAVAPPIG